MTIITRDARIYNCHFNPHPYVRDDLFQQFFQMLVFDFNPHPYVRDDTKTICNGNCSEISIHIPT